MTAPRAATTTTKGRTYTLELPEPAGKVVLWSVTTLIDKGLPKPALVPWAMKATAESMVRDYKRLYAMVEAAGGDPDALQGVISWAKGAAYRDRDKAADAGTLFHQVAEAYALGKPRPVVPPALAAKVAHFDRFIADWRPEFVATEMTVYSIKESFAGTLDAIVRMGLPAKTYLIDWKTGKDVYPDAAVQLAAYSHAEAAYLAPGLVQPLPEVDGTLVVHVTDDGYRVVPVDAGEAAWRAFRVAREVARWMEEASKVALSEPLSPPVFPVVAPRRRSRRAAA